MHHALQVLAVSLDAVLPHQYAVSESHQKHKNSAPEWHSTVIVKMDKSNGRCQFLWIVTKHSNRLLQNWIFIYYMLQAYQYLNHSSYGVLGECHRGIYHCMHALAAASGTTLLSSVGDCRRKINAKVRTPRDQLNRLCLSTEFCSGKIYIYIYYFGTLKWCT